MRQLRSREIKQLAQGPRATAVAVGFEPRKSHCKSGEHRHLRLVGDWLHGVGQVGGGMVPAKLPKACLCGSWLANMEGFFFACTLGGTVPHQLKEPSC